MTLQPLRWEKKSDHTRNLRVDVCIVRWVCFGFVDYFYVGLDPRNMEGPVSEPTISDLDAAFAELAHWGAPLAAVQRDGDVYVLIQDIKICPGFKGQTRGSGKTLSQAIYAALEQLRVVRATVPPIPRVAEKEVKP